MTEPRPYIDQELLTEIFGFLPTDILDSLNAIFNSLVYNTLEGIEQRVRELCPDEEKVLYTMKKMESYTDQATDATFNMFQQYVLQNTWKMNPNLDIKPPLLRDVTCSVTDETEALMNEEIENMKKALLGQKQLEAFLKEQTQKLEQQDKELDQLEELLNFLTEVPQEHGVTDMVASTKFVKENIEYIYNNIKQTLDQMKSQFDSISPQERDLLVRETIDSMLKTLLQ